MKKYLFTLIPFVLSIVCIVAFNIIGSEVAADGTLIEPFYLVPMAYLFFALAIVVGIVTISISRKRYKKSHE